MDGASLKLFRPATDSLPVKCIQLASYAKRGNVILMVAMLDVFVVMLLVLDEMLDAFVLMRVESDVKDPLKSTPDKDTAGVLRVPSTVTLPPSEVFPLTLRLPTSVEPISTEF
jgi:hypothetical protein